jgi:hypothetical protein
MAVVLAFHMRSVYSISVKWVSASFVALSTFACEKWSGSAVLARIIRGTKIRLMSRSAAFATLPGIVVRLARSPRNECSQVIRSTYSLAINILCNLEFVLATHHGVDEEP